MSFFFGDNSSKRVRPELPDYSALWKQYKGELDNINRRTEGGIADIRARMAAVGATGEITEGEINRIKGEGNLEIAALRNSTTYSLLEEGFAIATQQVGNPYDKPIAGVQDFMLRTDRLPDKTIDTSAGRSVSSVTVPQYSAPYRRKALPTNLEQYFGEYYPFTPDKPGSTADRRAEAAAAGASGGVSATSGAASNPLLPVMTQEEIWR